MDRESIDKEYADLCLKYGDLSQKIQHLEEEEIKAIDALNEQIDQTEQAYIKARVPLRKELTQIEERWKELKALVKETHLQPEASKPE
jgi:hypothetical protein